MVESPTVRVHPLLKRAIGLMVVLGLLCAVYFVRRPSVSSINASARRALAANDFKTALALANDALQSKPINSESLLILAEAQIGLGEFAQAHSALERIPVSLSQHSLDGRITSGRLLMHKLGRPNLAEERLRSILEDQPDHSDALFELATLLGALTRQREAVPLVIRLLRQKRVDIDLLVLILEDDTALARPGLTAPFLETNPDDPSVLLTRAWQARNSPNERDPESAREILEAAVQAHPEFVPLKDSRAELLWEERLAGLVPRLRSCFESRGNGATSTSPIPAKLWNIRGWLAETNGDKESAARCYWEAFRSAPTNRQAVYNLSRMAEQLGRTEESKQLRQHLVVLRNLKRVADNALSSEHESLEPLLDLSRALESVGRLHEAWGWCQMAVRIDPQAALPRERAAILRDKLKGCPEQRVCSDALNVEVDFSAYELPRWEDYSSFDLAVGDPAKTEDHPAITFQDDAERLGISFTYFNSPSAKAAGQRMYEFAGGGCGVLDYDVDGWPDLYFSQGCRWPVELDQREHLDRLFRNVANDQFEDVTLLANIVEDRFSAGVAVGDLNNDGFPDVYISNVGTNRLYFNNGDGTFDEVSDFPAGEPRWSTSSVIADINGDGLPDIYSANYLDGKDVFDRVCQHNDGKPRMCMPFQFNAAQDRLFINDGDGRFRDATPSSGIVVPDGKGLGVVAADLLGDSRLELFVANDTTMNSLFVHEPDSAPEQLRLEEVGLASGVAVNGNGRAEGCMGIAVGDVDNDGRLDLFVTNFHHETNSLFLQREPGLFSERTREAGLAAASYEVLGFGTDFLDGDLDGDLDVLITNGHIDDLSAYGRPYRMPSQLFANRGRAKFVKQPPQSAGKFFREERLGRSLAKFDWNRDGKPDAAISFLDRPAAVLTNSTTDAGKSIVLYFRGVESSRDAIGVTVRATIAEETLTRQVTAGGYQSSSQRLVVIGLGDAAKIDSLEVRWPAGTLQVFHDLAAGRAFMLIESAAQPFVLPRTVEPLVQRKAR